MDIAPAPHPTPTGIHILPTELITIVLDALCSDARYRIVLPPPGPGVGVLCFSQVCRLWRNIACNCPSLWTKYSFDFHPRWTRLQFKALVRALRKFIPRAQTHATNFIIAQTSPSPHISPAHFLEFLATFAPCLGALELRVCISIAAAFGAAPAIPFEKLRQFRMQMCPTGADMGQPLLLHHFPNTTNVFAAAPMLTDVGIAYDGWWPLHLPVLQLREWNFPLHQLSKFQAPNVYIETVDCIQVLTHCPNLVQCFLSCDGPDSRPLPDVETPCILQHLHLLHFTFRSLHSEFWDYITAPNLRDLGITTLSDDNGGAEWDNTRFMSFHQRSGCSLATLVLEFDFTAIVDAIIDILEVSPALYCLELRWTQLYFEPDIRIARLLDWLSVHPGRPLWLPNLGYMRLDATEDSLRMLQSRCIPPVAEVGWVGAQTPLECVRLVAEEPFDHRTLFATEVAALRAAGIQVDFECMDFYGARDLQLLNDAAADQEMAAEDGDAEGEGEGEGGGDDEMADEDGEVESDGEGEGDVEMEEDGNPETA
ncbi:hypothetical protein B0H17DRAFT_1143466 [Mycena rosella]|uniref:F-box domain-containing protein n=1 Tax=Mycena rosella TaxID=1033263 RepID=A0AAD7CV52_MYCRO|nr:hypothetical protein B0H17DRAFT_1143466 [Mycena rosella]